MDYIRKKYDAAVKDEIALEAGLCPIIPVKIEKWMASVVKHILWKFNRKEAIHLLRIPKSKA